MASQPTTTAEHVESPPAATAPAPSTSDTPPSLWRDGDFLKLWGGQSLSLFGSQLTLVALPLVAVQLLHATAGQMGLLGALSRAPFVLFLFAGVWADRVRRRPTMIVTDLGRAVGIAMVPILFFAGWLDFAWVCVIALVVGVLGVFFEVSNQAFLPSLLGKSRVPEGNAKFQVSQSLAQVGGPSLAGVLIAFFSAASIMIVDAASYVVGAVTSALIRKPEQRPEHDGAPPKVFAAIGAGMKWVWTQPIIRPILLSVGLYMTFTAGIQALYVFYLRETLDLSASLIGFTLAFLGVGAVLGSLLSMRTLRRIGPGPAAFWATVLGNGAFLLVPFAGGPTWVMVTMLAGAQFLIGVTGPVAQVGMGSLRMVLTPNSMQGRVVGTFRGLSLGLAPLGALAGGLLAAAVGTRPVMFGLAIGVLTPILVMLFSPLPRVTEFPSPPDGD
jgi:predicted MFS family arabinose efflux permease